MSNAVGFLLRQIKTEQFAFVEDMVFTKTPIDIDTKLDFSVDSQEKSIKVLASFRWRLKNNEFMKIQVSCLFLVQPDSWKDFAKPNGIVVPKQFLTHLCIITVGATRGILHAKTEGTMFNLFMLPTINLTDFIKEDLVYPLN